jgi:hypothetical protein
MNFQNTCKIPVVLTSKPYERQWESKDKVTGEAKKGSVSVIRGVMIPPNADADPSSLKEIEFNISTSKIGGAEKNAFEVMEVYYENKGNFESGKSYAMIETYMGPRLNKDGVVSFFSPWINDLEVITTSTEDQPLVKVVTARNEQL